MAQKRQRANESPDRTASSGYGLQPFGQDSIHKVLKGGNPNFARGAFGEISIALQRHDDTGDYTFVAVKTIEQAIPSPASLKSFGSSKQQQTPKLSRDIFNELCALVHLNPHPNIVQLVAFYPTQSAFGSSTSLSLVFSYSPIDLHLALQWRRRACLSPLGFDVIKAIAYDLFSALSHCHELGVLHRDVKPGNLLVTPAGTIQLCDFGLAKPFTDEQSHTVGTLPSPSSGETGTKGLCTLFYRPPEVLLGGLANHPAIDMYSAGTTIAELIGGRPLMEGHNVLEQLSLVFDYLGTPSDTRWPSARLLPDYGKLEFAAREPKSWTERLPRVLECEDLSDFLYHLVALDPAQRMDATRALQHGLFTSGDETRSSNPYLRDKLPRELIHSSLQIPPLLAPNKTETMEAVAIFMATKRRTFLSKKLSSWQGAELPMISLKDTVGNKCYM